MEAVDLRESARVLIAGLSANRDAYADMVTQLEAFLAGHDLGGLTPLPPVPVTGRARGRTVAADVTDGDAPPPRRATTRPRRETNTAIAATNTDPDETDPPAGETNGGGRAKAGAHDGKVLVTLRDHPYGLSLSDVSRAVFGRERTAKSVGSMKNVLDRLVRDGQVVREGRIYKRADLED